MAAELLTDASRATDANANPLPGATWTFYATGTTTLQAVYTDAALTTPHTNPVVADAGGSFAPIYFDSGLIYRGILRNAAGVPVPNGDVDPINAAILAQIYPKLYQIKAVGDYSTPAVADATALELYVPTNTVSTVANGAGLLASYWGPGQIVTADGNKRGRYFGQCFGRPATLGNHDSIDTAFNGDMSKCLFPVEYRIMSTTLGTPATGYQYTPEATPYYTVLYIGAGAGHNQSTSSNVGRTQANAFRVNLKHVGNGDAVAYNATCYVAGAKAGATNFLAQPAAGLFAGDISAGADHVYLNPREIICHDNGFDVACVGDVINLDRTNATGAQGVFWSAYRAQSVGAQPVDNIVSAIGKFRVGFDVAMSAADFGVNKTPISLKAGDRIGLANASTNGLYTDTFNGWYISYETTPNAIVVTANGNAVLQVSTDRISGTKPFVSPMVAVASLPVASIANKGMEYFVTDANATTRAAIVAGGGANFQKVYCDGTNWRIL